MQTNNLIQPKYLKTEDYLREVNQDLIIPVNTVHDEVNIGVDRYLLKPILKKLISIGMAKKILDKFGFIYMNFLYDVEFSYTGEFTGEGSEGVADFNTYELPLHREEHIARDKFLKSISKFQKTQKVIKKKISLKKFQRLGLSKKLTKYHTTNEDKVIELTIIDNDQKFRYKHLLTTHILKII